MEKIKTLLPGILIGVVLTVGTIAAWNYAEDVATKKMAEKFLSGYQQAEDKVAFTKEFAKDKGGISISTASAEDPCVEAHGFFMFYLTKKLETNDNELYLAYHGASEEWKAKMIEACKIPEGGGLDY